jgi:FkbM family methyltransferase
MLTCGFMDRAVLAVSRKAFMRNVGNCSYPRRGSERPVRLLCAIRARRTFQAPALPGIELHGPGSDLFAKTWLYQWQRLPYDGLARAIHALVGQGQVVADVGAYMGWYSYLMAIRVGRGGRVHVFEPNPAFRPILESSVGRFLTVRTHFVGASDHAGTLPFHCSPVTSESSFVTPPSRSHAVTVPVRRLDVELGEEASALAFIKIDVEGYEPAVLGGLDSILFGDGHKPILFLEMSEPLHAAREQRPSRVLDLLHAAEYAVYMVPTLTWRPGLPLKPLGDRPDSPVDGWMDAIAVPKCRYHELEMAIQSGLATVVDSY